MKTEAIWTRSATAEESEKFFRALRESRLMNDDELRSIEERLTEYDLSGLQKLLVEEGILTAYQLSRLRRGRQRGLVLGPYRILDKLGQGGGGEVFRALHSVMDRVVALKVITAENTSDRISMESFSRELAAATRLDHPNIARMYDANEDDGNLYLALELVNGPTLHSHVAENGPLALPFACSVLIQSAQALQHAHESGLVHRDIKPANLMLPGAILGDSAGQKPKGPVVKLLDFGLARCTSQASLATIQCPSDMTLGTPPFMSPEQIRNIHGTDARSDIYSLGCTMYFALTGRQPFEAGNSQLVMNMHLECEPKPIRSWRNALPVHFCAIIHRMMAKNPADRYQTAEQLNEAVNEFVLTGGLGESEAPTHQVRTYSEVEFALTSHPPEREVEETPVPLVEPSLPPSDAIRDLWLPWCETIRRRASNQPQQRTDSEYRELYRQILAEAGATGGTGHRIIALVEPWVNLRALETADGRTVQSVWQHCQGITREYWPESLRSGTPSWVGPVAIAAAVAAAAVCWILMGT